MIRAIVTDIEGTTSDIRFVHDVLFPYARERLAAFVTAQQYAEPVKSILDNLRDEIDTPHASVSDLIETLFTFMDEDRKSTALKALQEGAKDRGANAVIDIVSYFKKNEFRSATHYECYAGNIMSGVAFKATYAKVK